jgi:glyoxylate utilization-related uncharacterized protein
VELPAGEAAPVLAPCGEQFLWVLAGVVEVEVAGGVHALREGDALHCMLNDGGAVRNRGDQPARFLWAASPAASL